MAFEDHFKLADDLITHLDVVIKSVTDPFLSSRYVGFVAIVAVTVYELAIKEIFYEFSNNKHKVLGNFAKIFFDRINGRIKTSIIKKDYLPRYGDKYVNKFKNKLEKMEKEILTTKRISISSSYNNIIEWRNQFAHEGVIPSTVSYIEAIKAYNAGKEIVKCLAETMRR